MKMAMLRKNENGNVMKENGDFWFVYRHPQKHRLVCDYVEAEDVPDLFASLQTHSLVNALENIYTDRSQDWRGYSPNFKPEWREAFQNSDANSEACIRRELLEKLAQTSTPIRESA